MVISLFVAEAIFNVAELIINSRRKTSKNIAQFAKYGTGTFMTGES